MEDHNKSSLEHDWQILPDVGTSTLLTWVCKCGAMKIVIHELE